VTRKPGVRVIRAGDGRWRVECVGVPALCSSHASQADAWRTAREIARLTRVRAALHGRNGNLRTSIDYSRPRHSTLAA